MSHLQDKYDTAARYLLEAKRTRQPIDGLPETCRPVSIEEALGIQRRAFDLSGEALGGWKCSVPAGDRMIVARLPASTVFRSSPCFIVPKSGVLQIEPEIAFILKHDLLPRETPYSEAEVRDAIREARLVLELMGSRYVDVSAVTFFENLADGVRHQGMFMGPILPNPFQRAIDTFHLTIAAAGRPLVDREARHPNGHPLKPLHWLANFLSSRRGKLEADKIITTGSYAGIVDVPLDVPITVTYGTLGSLCAEFHTA